MRQLLALFSGSVFGAGLYAAGATNTNVVHGWMDVAGDWNPALGIMFLCSFVVAILAWQFAERRKVGLLGDAIQAKSNAAVTSRLIIGATLFGIGWGISGMCPGPSLAAATFNGVGGLVYVIAMVVGLKLGAIQYCASSLPRAA